MTVTSRTTKKCDEKTWANFQANFQAVQQKYKRKQKSSTCTGGYHGANNIKQMNGMHDDPINLATTAAEDRDTTMLQNKTIADLTKTVANLTWQLQQATTEYHRGPGLPVDRRIQKIPNG